MGKFLKWGVGLSSYALTIAPLFLFSQSNNVVGDIKSSATLSYYEKGNNESVVILGKDTNEILYENMIIKLPIKNESSYHMYDNFLLKAEKEEEQRNKQRMAELKKLREEYERQLKEKQMPSRGSATVNDKFYVEASAYTSHCYGCSGKTFTGYNVRHTTNYNGMRIIATDNSILPLNTIVKISYDDTEFYGICLDRGGAIKGYKIDLLVEDYNTAINFGRKKVLIEVIKYGE